MKFLEIFGLGLLFSLMPACCSPDDKKADDKDSPLGFVQDFYNWYTPKALADGPIPACKFVVDNRIANFNHELLNALKEDIEAQEKVEGEIVGIDFDPFLASQDPCERYEAGRVINKGAHYLVEIHSICSGIKNNNVDVTADLIRENNRWIFVNFLYSDNNDLINVLKYLRESRK
jgi:hypothetical protein